jgi:putative heme-binding domain-containing protein
LLSAIGSLGLKNLNNDVLAVAAKSSNDTATRQQAIAVVIKLRADGTSIALRQLLTDGDPAIRQTALNALVDSQDLKTLREVLTGEKFPADMRQSVSKRLMESTGGALVLLRMIDNNELAPALKEAVIASATAHPDANARLLFEKFVPEDKRIKKLGTTIKPEEILALKGDPTRGEQIFNLSSAAQCKSCHVVHGVGGSIGPDLSMIGRKYDRAALLETILQPSKAIAHEYRPYMLETAEGQVFVGFLAEKTDQQVVLKDIKGNLTRVPAGEVEALVEQEKSLMPELVLQEVTAQDAADLLAFMTTLKQSLQTATSFRILGPFPIRRGDLEGQLEPEQSVTSPDWKAQFKEPNGKSLHWEVVQTVNLPFPAFDSVRYDRDRKWPNNDVAHYCAVIAESNASQPATLQVGSDDGVKIWVNGKVVHKNNTTRAVVPNQDCVDIQLKPGRNVLVFKVINGNGNGGLTAGIRASEPVELGVE